jgi:serine phosphatase RsbU (regulator of sigma subunit)
VTEAANRKDEEYGEDRLIDVAVANRRLGTQELHVKIPEAATEFSEGNFQDDATLIVMSVESNDADTGNGD